MDGVRNLMLAILASATADAGGGRDATIPVGAEDVRSLVGTNP
jgi:hypothetical protein